MSEKLKPCPFCGQNVQEKLYRIPFDTARGAKITQCQCGAFLSSLRWNTRPLEDAANARAEAAEARAEQLQAVIIGMFPMWINAMSYCEHGRQSELLAMRNYYNGRANPMTNDDISLMFSVIPEKNEGGWE